MNKYTMYASEFCGKEFSSASECEEHEESHNHDYSFDADTVIIQRLREMKSGCYDYRIGNTVMGMPVTAFSSLIETAANRLEDLSNTALSNDF